MNRIEKLVARPGIAMGVSTVHQLIANEDQAGLLVGISEFVPGSVEVEMTYDEGIFVLEGTIEIDGDAETHFVKSGEFLWIPSGRKIVYRALEHCRFFYVIPGAVPQG